MTTDELLAALEQDMDWRTNELNEIVRNLSGDDDLRSRTQRRGAVPLIYAHAEGFVRFALMSYVRFINAQLIAVDVLRNVHVAWALRSEFNTVRSSSVDNGYTALGLDENDKSAKKHYGETRFLDRFDALKADIVVLDDQPLVQFDQNLDDRYLRALLFRCGLDVNRHGYAGQLNGLVLRRNEVAHGETSVPNEPEIKRWDGLVREVMTTMTNEVYESARARSYLRAA